MMTFLKTISAAAIICVSGSIASAATVTSDSVTLEIGDVGFSWFVDWEGELGGEDLSVTSTWTLDSYDDGVWGIGFTIENESSDGARITAWGLNTDPDATNFTLDQSNVNDGWKAFTSNNGLIDEDLCAGTGNQNCNGGGGGGLTPSDGPYDFLFTIEVESDTVTLDHFVIRLQSVGTDDEDSIALKGVVTPVPLPAAGWLLLGGMGGLLAMKRRMKS